MTTELSDKTEYRKDWKHRAQGVIELLFVGALGMGMRESNSGTAQAVAATCGALMTIDAAGDLITGYHHYCFCEASKYVEKLINKIRNYRR